MSLELETGLPSTRLLQTYVRDQRTVEITLTTGKAVQGPIAWQDPLCICLHVEGEPMLIWRSALATIKAVA